MTWIKSRGSRDKTRSNTAVAIFQSSLILLICLDVKINVMDRAGVNSSGAGIIQFNSRSNSRIGAELELKDFLSKGIGAVKELKDFLQKELEREL